MPSWARHVFVIGVLLTLLPLALIARSRWGDSEGTRIHIIRDMDKQGRYETQGPGPLFADGRAMRPEVPGTVARGELREDDHYYRGKVGGDWAEDFPLPLSAELLRRGRERYDIFCALCHGFTGNGDGMIAVRADQLAEGTWTPPSSLHDQIVRERPVGHLFNSIGRGIRNMPAYGSQIPEDDRWAIVAYVRALQLSRSGRLEDVPADRRGGLQ